MKNLSINFMNRFYSGDFSNFTRNNNRRVLFAKITWFNDHINQKNLRFFSTSLFLLSNDMIANKVNIIENKDKKQYDIPKYTYAMFQLDKSQIKENKLVFISSVYFSNQSINNNYNAINSLFFSLKTGKILLLEVSPYEKTIY